MKKDSRFIISSDIHHFVGRIFGLSIVSMHFDSYQEASVHPDAKYVLDVNERMSLLVRRVESLNHVGHLLWPKPPIRIDALPVSAFDFCNLIQDVFLMRIISILDCCCLLAMEVLELDLKPRQANVDRIRARSGNHPCCGKLQALSDLQLELRAERNVRFHRGEQKTLTNDDITFQVMARFKYMQDMTGTDCFGKKVNLKMFYKDAIGRLRQKFIVNVETLSEGLDAFYETLADEFETRFRRKFRAETGFGRTHGVFAANTNTLGQEA